MGVFIIDFPPDPKEGSLKEHKHAGLLKKVDLPWDGFKGEPNGKTPSLPELVLHLALFSKIVWVANKKFEPIFWPILSSEKTPDSRCPHVSLLFAPSKRGFPI